MTDDERGEYEDVILNLLRIIKAWEEERVYIDRYANGEKFYATDGPIADFDTPAEAYAALERELAETKKERAGKDQVCIRCCVSRPGLRESGDSICARCRDEIEDAAIDDAREQ